MRAEDVDVAGCAGGVGVEVDYGEEGVEEEVGGCHFGGGDGDGVDGVLTKLSTLQKRVGLMGWLMQGI